MVTPLSSAAAEAVTHRRVAVGFFVRVIAAPFLSEE
jgi:hypothetical protein